MKQTAILLPVDNRPVTCIFPQLICSLAGLNVLAAPRHLMGSLSAPTDIEAMWRWLEQAVLQVETGAIFICLDSLLYGGLIPARRSNDSLEIILARAEQIANLKKLAGGNLKIYAQSSIMRISDNYDNSEEKSYWSEYGREIFHWSELLHKKEIGMLDTELELEKAQLKIKNEIRTDYLSTRERNFNINKKIIDYVVSGDIDYLIFSQDDSGKFGLNVLEKDKLMRIAKEKNISNIQAYAGADEVLMSLVAYHLNSQRQILPEISVRYSAPTGKDIASNYEGQSIGRSLECQAKAQGLQINQSDGKVGSGNVSDVKSSDVDFMVIVHTGLDEQGDHIWLPGLKDLRLIETSTSAVQAIALIEHSKAPVIICDVVYSNGADPALIDLLLKRPQLFEKIWSYAGWNTTGNTIGSALAVGSACLYANTNGALNKQDRLNLLFLRLLDDWAYQTQVRKELPPGQLTEYVKELTPLMDKYAAILTKALNFKPHSIKYSLPWQRSFEVEIATTLP